ncbi:IPT/TIG domain-containing protein [Actinoplanes derwentensis]|uniref:IPT/TIG domain-containing protein n=1 Tax=Actinoplanes derwentensis TaxID=113562 RepID=A0A1H2D919_9ACTN|nr:IPT/TIG domain-containing protein [Actinoplanes derwentensis]GID86391.1 hypothetical protein Ade03nite_53150 [Actinoplanes derwentensis]SDT79089.1 IPT/TIG domain-containing protein [Actinoplanes derwentensis]
MPKIRKKSVARALGTATTSVAAAAAALVATGQPAQAATVSAVSAPAGATVRVTDAGLSTATGQPAVLLRTDACANYAVPATPVVAAEAATKVDAGTISFRVPVLPLGTNGVAKPYNVCVYSGATANTPTIGGAAPVLTTYQNLTSNPSSGLSGATNNLSLTSSTPIFTGITSPAALFTANACPALYNVSNGTFPAVAVKTGLANATATVTVPSSVVGAGTFNTCVYAGSTGTDALLGASTYQTTLPQLTLSSSSGPYDSTNNITASSGTNSLFSGITAPGVLFSTTTCAANYDTMAAGTVAVPSAGIRKLANNRLAVTVPKLPITNQQPKTYQLCAYTGSSGESTVLGSAPYTSTVVPNPTSITPNAGPSTGGITVTVNGTDFPTAPGSISATLGGAELLNVTPVNPTSFTATLPARSAGDNAALVVNTIAGSRTLPGAFSFRNALKLLGTTTAPNTSSATDLVVQGTDFLSQAFGTSSDSAKIYLVRGEYDGSQAEGGNRANGPVAECTNPLVLSDTELVCTLRLNRRLDKTGSAFVDPLASVQPLTGLTTVLGSRLLVSATGVFGLDDVGRVIAQTGGDGEIPTGTSIKSVLTPFLAILSAPSPVAGSSLTADLGGALRTIAAGTGNGVITTAASNVIQLTGTPLTKADVGRVFKDTTGILDGTSITAVAPNGASATLSAPASASNSATVSVSSAALGSTTLTGTFTAGDVGSVFGAGNAAIPAGTKILSQTGGTTATISQATVAAITAPATPAVDRPVTLNLFPGAPVLDGAYNVAIVSNGAVGASASSDYKQTTLTSGSIFTVSPF